MSARTLLAIPLVALLLGLGPAAADEKKEKPLSEDAKKAEKLVEDELTKLKAAGARFQAMPEESLGRSFPSYQFVSVVFPQFPVARVPPGNLKAANVYAVKDGKLQLLSDLKELETFFGMTLGPVKEAKAGKDAMRSWLRLTSEFSQDGFYNFDLADDSIKAAAEGDAWKASGKIEVRKEIGNKGDIAAELTFDKAGKLTKVSENRNVVRGMRPRCQATKLLDPDPIVRAMAEQDLLVIGRAGKDYLDEQRAKASPDLKQAIDRIWKQIVDERR